MSWIAHRNVQFVSRDDAQSRIAVLPPELVANRGDLHGRRGFPGILDRMNHACRREKQDKHNQDGNDGPSQLNLRAPVHLGRFASGCQRLVTELDDGLDQQGDDDEEDQTGDSKDEIGMITDGLRGR